ncbi:MAG: hypothetical protein IPJ88_08075 [Myxococcales bacterium]|nr:MAG: hypothetical protein IPJ88_08075 [Myxococcales bacterium]
MAKTLRSQGRFRGYAARVLQNAGMWPDYESPLARFFTLAKQLPEQDPSTIEAQVEAFSEVKPSVSPF